MELGEFRRKLKSLSNRYSVRKGKFTDTVYIGKTKESNIRIPVIRISAVKPRSIENLYQNEHWNKLPFGDKVWMLAAEYAGTPVDKRIPMYGNSWDAKDLFNMPLNVGNLVSTPEHQVTEITSIVSRGGEKQITLADGTKCVTVGGRALELHLFEF